MGSTVEPLIVGNSHTCLDRVSGLEDFPTGSKMDFDIKIPYPGPGGQSKFLNYRSQNSGNAEKGPVFWEFPKIQGPLYKPQIINSAPSTRTPTKRTPDLLRQPCRDPQYRHLRTIETCHRPRKTLPNR